MKKHTNFSAKLRAKTKNVMIRSIKKMNIRKRFRFFKSHLDNDNDTTHIYKFMRENFDKERTILATTKNNIEKSINLYNK